MFFNHQIEKRNNEATFLASNAICLYLSLLVGLALAFSQTTFSDYERVQNEVLPIQCSKVSLLLRLSDCCRFDRSS